MTDTTITDWNTAEDASEPFISIGIISQLDDRPPQSDRPS